jgi:hypothetical protein
MTISNLFLSATVFVLFFVIFGDAQGTYLEHAQIPLYAILVTEIALILGNKRFKNPLLDILNLIFVVFFLLRVPFVYSDAVNSDIYLRSANIDRVGEALYVLNFELIVLALCVLIINPAHHTYKKIIVSQDVWHRILKLTSFILLFNIVNVASNFKLSESNSLISVVFALFNWGSILILLVPLLMFADKSLENKYRLYLYLQLSICVLLVLFTGSKSGLFQIFGIYFVALLAIHGSSYKIPGRTLIIGSIVLMVAILMFVLGDIFNKINRNRDVLDFSDMYRLFLIALENLSAIFNGVSYRMGYLDFYVDKLTQDVYASAFDVKYYIMAFVNAVTPGFDVFEPTSLVSRAVYNNFFGISDGPNSEAVTVFAEAHRLAGYFSFIPYSFVLLVMLFVRKHSSHWAGAYGAAIQSIFICYIFFRYLLGFGIDYWLFGDVVYPFLFVALSFRFMGLTRTKGVTKFSFS